MSGERIEALLAEIRTSANPATTVRVEALVEEIVGLYGAGLARVWQLLVEAGRSTDAVRGALADDPLVSALLTLHGLHPQDVAARIEEALERVRPYLAAHAGGVALVGMDGEGVARVRLEGSCGGCASSAATLRDLVERAIHEAAPEVERVVVDTATLEPEARLVHLGRRAP
jgi:Fe-S cluster biogenesis protein NfuA